MDLFELLPSEILISVLSYFPTSSLLALAAISRRFYAVAGRILRHRMSHAARLPGHDLVLECYHPSAKTSTPYFYSEYLGTDGLDAADGAGGAGAYSDGMPIASLKGLYSRFRPVVQEEARRPRSRYPLRSQQQQQQQVGNGASLAVAREGEVAPALAESERELPTQDVHLEGGELFSQLCTLTNVGKLGPKRGIYLSHVNVSDGLIRVWRDWLAAAATRTAADVGTAMEADAEMAVDCGSAKQTDPSILWADTSRSVGLRFRVHEIAAGSQDRPILVRADEDLPVSYRLEFLELLVRTRKLLLALEESEVMRTTIHSGAIYINPRGTHPQPIQSIFWADISMLTPHQDWSWQSGIRVGRWLRLSQRDNDWGCKEAAWPRSGVLGFLGNSVRP